jgi:hypothetical protein
VKPRVPAEAPELRTRASVKVISRLQWDDGYGANCGSREALVTALSAQLRLPQRPSATTLKVDPRRPVDLVLRPESRVSKKAVLRFKSDQKRRMSTLCPHMPPVLPLDVPYCRAAGSKEARKGALSKQIVVASRPSLPRPICNRQSAC